MAKGFVIEKFLFKKDRILMRYKGNGGEVVIPDGVTAVDRYAFFKCSGIKKIKPSKKLKTIGAANARVEANE